VFAIRRYQPADREAVWSLHNLSLRQAGVHAGDGPWDDDLRQIETAYLANGGDFIVGTIAERIVVMGALRRQTAEVAEVTRMRVHPDVQGRGFGRAILLHLEARARRLGYTTLVLDTTPAQHAALALYCSHGFAEVGQGPIPGMPAGMPPAIFLAKRLTSSRHRGDPGGSHTEASGRYRPEDSDSGGSGGASNSSTMARAPRDP
jgi:GNAT superfamily N-acetyltransferase